MPALGSVSSRPRRTRPRPRSRPRCGRLPAHRHRRRVRQRARGRRGIRRVRRRPSEVFIETKIWISDYGYDETLHGFEKSAGKLGVDQIDLLILHQALPSAFDKTLAAYRALEKLLADGKVRAIGVSNFMVDHLTALLDKATVVPAVNQIEVHPYFAQREVQASDAEHGILTQAWSPIGGITFYRDGEHAAAPCEDPVIGEIAEGARQDPGPGDAALAPAAGPLGDPEVHQAGADRRELRRVRLRAHRRAARRDRRPGHRQARRPRARRITLEPSVDANVVRFTAGDWVFVVERSAWLRERHDYETRHYETPLLDTHRHYLFVFHDEFVEAIAAGIWLDLADRADPFASPGSHPLQPFDVDTPCERFTSGDGLEWELRRSPRPDADLIRDSRYCSQRLFQFNLPLDGDNREAASVWIRTTDDVLVSRMSRPWVGDFGHMEGFAQPEDFSQQWEAYLGEVARRRRGMVR
jgi:hypothetical protein